MATPAETQASVKISDGLAGITVVVYGVAITQALTTNGDVLLHPFTTANHVAAVGLVAAVILSIYGFFSYILAIQGPYSYNIYLTPARGKKWDAMRFAYDLVVAGLYVRFLLAATVLGDPVYSGGMPPRGPDLRLLFDNLALVMMGIVVSRVIRYVVAQDDKSDICKRKNLSRLLALPSVLGITSVAIGLIWADHYHTSQEDLAAVLVMLLLIVIYIFAQSSFHVYIWEHVTKPALDKKANETSAVSIEPKWSDDNQMQSVRDSLQAVLDRLQSAS